MCAGELWNQSRLFTGSITSPIRSLCEAGEGWSRDCGRWCMATSSPSLIPLRIDIHREIDDAFTGTISTPMTTATCIYRLPASISPLLTLDRNPSLALRYAVAVGCLVITVRLFHRMLCGRSTRTCGAGSGRYGAGLLTLQFILNDLDDGGPHLILLGILASGSYAIWVGKERLGAALLTWHRAQDHPALFVLLFLGGNGESPRTRYLPRFVGSVAPFIYGTHVGGSITGGPGMPCYPCLIGRQRVGRK